MVCSSSGCFTAQRCSHPFGLIPTFALLACCSPLPFRGLGKPVDLLDFILVYTPFGVGVKGAKRRTLLHFILRNHQDNPKYDAVIVGSQASTVSRFTASYRIWGPPQVAVANIPLPAKIIGAIVPASLVLISLTLWGSQRSIGSYRF
jgi:hypothetical protein